MIEELKKIEEMKNKFISFSEFILKENNNHLTKEVVFAGMIIKKTIDILDASCDALKKYNVNVHISLLRLLCDNCLAIQSVKELSVETVMDMIQNNERVNNVKIDEEQNMSDGYLKKKVSMTYPGFDKVYKFACDSVHFSKQAMTSSFITEKDGKYKPHFEVGNKEMKDVIFQNNNSLIKVSKIILDMLIKVCCQKQ